MATVLRAIVGRIASNCAVLPSVGSQLNHLMPSQSSRYLQTIIQMSPSISTSKPVLSYTAAAARRTLTVSSFTPLSASTSLLFSASEKLNRVCVTPRRDYRVRVVLKKRCSGCYFVKRKGRLFVECKLKPRHKQMQKISKHKLWKEDYSEGNIKKALDWKFKNTRAYYIMGDTPYARHNWLKGKIGVTV